LTGEALFTLEEKVDGCVVVTLLIPLGTMLNFDLSLWSVIVEDVTAKFGGGSGHVGEQFLTDIHKRVAHIEITSFPDGPTPIVTHADLAPPLSFEDHMEWSIWRRMLLTRRKQLQIYKVQRKKQLVASSKQNKRNNRSGAGTNPAATSLTAEQFFAYAQHPTQTTNYSAMQSPYSSQQPRNQYVPVHSRFR